MAMVCPQCSHVYEQQERICPTCSIQLLFYAPMSGAAQTSTSVDEDSAGQWQHTALGRIAVGLILAQGLALGLKQLLTAGMMAGGEGAATMLWGTLTGLALLHSLHALGLFVGGALTGAGQERGALYGSVAGLLNGVIFLLLTPRNHLLLPSDAAHFAQPALHMLFGAIGGWVGSLIWKPTPRLALPAAKSNTPAPPMFEMHWLHGPIAWGRVIAGATIMTCGVVWSSLVMNWMIDASQGALNVTTHFQARLLSGEIAGLTMLAGAALAGASSWNGMKQGLCVGIGGAVLYVGFHVANPKAPLETVVFASTCMLGLGMIGGWFGGQLFPPISQRRRGRRIMDL